MAFFFLPVKFYQFIVMLNKHEHICHLNVYRSIFVRNDLWIHFWVSKLTKLDETNENIWQGSRRHCREIYSYLYSWMFQFPSVHDSQCLRRDNPMSIVWHRIFNTNFFFSSSFNRNAQVEVKHQTVACLFLFHSANKLLE